MRKEDAQHNLHVSQNTVHPYYFALYCLAQKQKSLVNQTIHKASFVAGVGPEPTTSGL